MDSGRRWEVSRRSHAIIQPCTCDQHGQQQAQGIDQQMPLTPFDLLASIISTLGAAHLRGLDREEGDVWTLPVSNVSKRPRTTIRSSELRRGFGTRSSGSRWAIPLIFCPSAKDFLMQVPVTLSHELGLDRPVYMGSSIGGHLAVDLALSYPEEFRDVIGLEAALATPGAYQDVWSHSQFSNDFKASAMYGLMSPTSSALYRRETSWVYSQGAPAVFKGDLSYYAVDHDLTETAAQIDTAKVAVYLLTGDMTGPAHPPWRRS
jgi:hypothetical protein